MQAKTFPENYVGKAGYGTIRWESDNTGVATVGINNGIVDCKSEGEANITVTYNDGRQSRNPKDKLLTKTVKINVKKKVATSKSSLPEAPKSPRTQGKGTVAIVAMKPKDLPNANRISIVNKPEGIVYRKGDTFILEAITLPENYIGKSGYGTINWKSSNTNVAVVDSKTGKVTITGDGFAQISVEYVYGQTKLECYTHVCSLTLVYGPKNIFTNILNKAEEIHKYMEDNNYIYAEKGEYIPRTFEESKKFEQPRVVCSTYVGWSLQEVELLPKDLDLSNCQLLEEALTNENGLNWKKHPGNKSILRPGDIIIYGYLPEVDSEGKIIEQHRNHAEIYAGNGKTLSAGDTTHWSNGTHYIDLREKNIKYDEDGNIDLNVGWDRYWVYRPEEYK